MFLARLVGTKYCQRWRRLREEEEDVGSGMRLGRKVGERYCVHPSVMGIRMYAANKDETPLSRICGALLEAGTQKPRSCNRCDQGEGERDGG